MSQKIYVLDEKRTKNSAANKVRGIGRYLTLLEENLSIEVVTEADLNELPHGAIVIDPHIDLNAFNYRTFPKNIIPVAVVYDLIPLKHTKLFPVGIRGKAAHLLNKVMLHRYSAVLTISQTAKRDLTNIAMLNKQNVHVIYPTWSNKLVSKVESKKTLSHPHLIYAGDVTRNKNIINLAYAIIHAEVPCIFVGSHFTKEKQEEVVSNNTHSPHPWLDDIYEFYRITYNNPLFDYRGYVTNDELTCLYSEATANILISHDEGFGLSYLEAGLQSTPSILSDIPVFREVAGESAIFVDKDSPQAIARGIQEMFESEHQDLSKLVTEQIQRYSPIMFRSSFMSFTNKLRTSDNTGSS